jgi:cell division ATPase FtsA
MVLYDSKIEDKCKHNQDFSDMYSGAIADISGVVRNCEKALDTAERQAGLQAKKVVIDKDNTTIVEGAGDTKNIQKRIHPKVIFE